MFFTGIHHPHNAHHVPRAFVSINALRGRKSDFPVRDWILDSGAFTTIAKHGGYPEPPEAYAAQIERWRPVGNMLRAVSQDWMCEPAMLERTGLDVAVHQRLTIDRYDILRALCGPIVMPVLQGYQPAEYVSHVEQYGDRLTPGMWVGVGSVCKRNGTPSAIAAVLDAILGVRPDLRPHLFGVKVTSLGEARVRDRTYSADSMAWSFAARYQGRDGNDVREAVRYTRRVETMAVQESLL